MVLTRKTVLLVVAIVLVVVAAAMFADWIDPHAPVAWALFSVAAWYGSQL